MKEMRLKMIEIIDNAGAVKSIEKIINIVENKILIKIPYDVKIVDLIQSSFDNRKWNSDKKIWEMSVNEHNIKAIYDLLKFDFFITKETFNKAKEFESYFEEQNKVGNKLIEMSKAKNSDIEIPKLKYGELYPYQKAGVEFIEYTNGKTLIADAMGCGKTLQAIAWTSLHPEKTPILVVCPATLKINWKREFEQWVGMKSIIIDTKFTLSDTIFNDTKIYIINYDIFKKKRAILEKLDIQVMILDECHNIKNPKAGRSKEITDFGKNIPHIIALTGTPILNRPIEIFNILKLLCPEKFGNYWNFVKRYCNAYPTKWGLNITGSSNIEELASLLRSTVMLRREKKDVLTELPDKTRTIIPLEIDLKQYKKVEDNLKKYLIEIKNKTEKQANITVEQLAKIEYCKQEAVKAKIPLFIEWVNDFMEVNNKLVIFAHHKEFIDQLMIELKQFNPVKIVGGMDIDSKQNSIDKFQDDKDVRIIICSMKAAGVGITLTAANYVAFLELGWTPGDHNQCEDRCHRIGIKDNVTCYYFLGINTIEESIYNLIQSKQKVFKQLMQDNNIIEESTTNVLDSLINLYS